MTGERALDTGELPLESPLWQFATSFWQMPGAEAACLALQSRGWSVNRILCAGWLASLGAHFRHEPDSVGSWRQQVTTPLRRMRQSIPRTSRPLEDLRSKLAASELEAEKVELALAFAEWSPTLRELPEAPDRETLLQQNIRAAAPPSAESDPDTERLLETLGKLLARHSLTPRKTGS